MKKLILLLFVSASVFSQEVENLSVTYIANCGFLFSSGDEKVIIDALYNESFGKYDPPSDDIIAKMEKGEKPFDKINLYLLTHKHGDHFYAPYVNKFLEHNKETLFISSNEACSQLENNGNVKDILLELGKTVDTTFNEIPLKIFRVKHLQDTTGLRINNYAFLININGVKIFHPGDITYVWDKSLLEKFHLDKEEIDVVFVPYFDLSETSAKYIKEVIKPKHIIAMHIPPNKYEEVKKDFLNVYPDGTILEKSLDKIEFDNIEIDYLGQTPPGDTPVIFSPGIVSVENKNSHALVFSQDGNMIVFSRYPDKASYIITKENNKWTEPAESFFYGKEASFSPDGKKIFYYTGGDIFYVEKISAGWNKPVRLGTNINTDNLIEFYPCIVKTGDLYFSRNGNWSTGRVMLSKYQDGEFQKGVDLGLTINNGGALHAWVSPDESFMLFNSPRTGSYTKLDIWISFHKETGNWTEPVNLGKNINSGADAILCPTVSPDGKYMFFTKLHFDTNSGYIYWVSTNFIDSLRHLILNNVK